MGRHTVGRSDDEGHDLFNKSAMNRFVLLHLCFVRAWKAAFSFDPCFLLFGRESYSFESLPKMRYINSWSHATAFIWLNWHCISLKCQMPRDWSSLIVSIKGLASITSSSSSSFCTSSSSYSSSHSSSFTASSSSSSSYSSDVYSTFFHFSLLLLSRLPPLIPIHLLFFVSFSSSFSIILLFLHLL